MLVIFIM